MRGRMAGSKDQLQPGITKCDMALSPANKLRALAIAHT